MTPVAADDPMGRIRQEVETLVSSGQLGAVLRDFVSSAPGLSIGAAGLVGYIVGAGVPPALLRLALSATARMGFGIFLQRHLFTNTRNA